MTNDIVLRDHYLLHKPGKEFGAALRLALYSPRPSSNFQLCTYHHHLILTWYIVILFIVISVYIDLEGFAQALQNELSEAEVPAAEGGSKGGAKEGDAKDGDQDVKKKDKSSQPPVEDPVEKKD